MELLLGVVRLIQPLPVRLRLEAVGATTELDTSSQDLHASCESVQTDSLPRVGKLFKPKREQTQSSYDFSVKC